jgi:hypothetical protein
MGPTRGPTRGPFHLTFLLLVCGQVAGWIPHSAVSGITLLPFRCSQRWSLPGPIPSLQTVTQTSFSDNRRMGLVRGSFAMSVGDEGGEGQPDGRGRDIPPIRICCELRHGKPAELMEMQKRDLIEVESLLSSRIEEGSSLHFSSIGEARTALLPFCGASTLPGEQRQVWLVRKNDELLGALFLGPAFTGRSSHVMSCTVVVARKHEGQGVGTLLGRVAAVLSRETGGETLLSPLIFVSNTQAGSLCRMLGWRLLGVLPRAGRLEDGRAVTDGMAFSLPLRAHGRTRARGLFNHLKPPAHVCYFHARLSFLLTFATLRQSGRAAQRR